MLLHHRFHQRQISSAFKAVPPFSTGPDCFCVVVIGSINNILDAKHSRDNLQRLAVRCLRYLRRNGVAFGFYRYAKTRPGKPGVNKSNSMARTITLRDSYAENRLFLNRAIFAFIGILLLMLVLASRLIYLQIVGHDHYASLSRHNRVKISPLVPTRGLIFDRNGKILAENQSTYSLELIQEQVPDLQATLAELKTLVNPDNEEIERFETTRRKSKPFVSIPLRLRLSDEEVSRFAVRRPHFQGVDIHARLVRYYPYRELTSHIVGYVGRINDAELRRIDPANYRGTHHIGKTGIEKFYEETLHGKTGYQETETNAQGRLIHSLDQKPPQPGADLHLTLDIDLQRSAYEHLGDYNGAVIAIEPQTGHVLAFVSKPGFDPNAFVYGISHGEYETLKTSPDRPLFNRALRGQYPPGSTIKPFIALAGLAYSTTTADDKLFCPGYYRLPNTRRPIRDWKKNGHGLVDMNMAITQSCDVYFYDLAYRLGIDRIHEYLRQFGFGEKTGIDIKGEKSGLLPSTEWKRRVRNQVWYPGETVIAGIGQGFIQTTPLQLAKATSVIAMRGKSAELRLLKRIQGLNGVTPLEPSPVRDARFDTANLDDVIAAMANVVHGKKGTARGIGKDLSYKMAGKTGTAQLFTIKKNKQYKANEIEKRLRDHALFIGFAPVDNPLIAIAVVVENGGQGSAVAAPIARTVIDQYLSTGL